MNLRSTVVLFTFFVPFVTSYNILVAYPHPGRSQFFTFVNLFKALARKGHKVTVLSHSPLKETVPNYRGIQIDSFVLPKINLTSSVMELKIMEYALPVLLADVGHTACEIAFNTTLVKSFLEEENSFDLAILSHFNTDCFVAVAKKLNIPVVRTLACNLLPWSYRRFGNPGNPAYIPNVFGSFSNKMSLFEKVENAIITLFHCAYYNDFVGVKNDEEVSMKYFGEYGASMKTDILKDSLLLMNTHYSVHFPIPLVPNVIEVGGIHLEVPKPLPKVRNEIKNYVNDVIL